MSLSLVSGGPQPPFNEPQTKCQSKGSLVQGQGFQKPQGSGKREGHAPGPGSTQTPALTPQSTTRAEGTAWISQSPGWAGGGSQMPTPFWLLQCRVLMMAPASSIIFRTVPPCTLPATLASSGLMILGGEEKG